ncbi:hypothetical protein K1719_026193 [Acacia pycnantha]|nr:hypothetical protein K1719_026193 [Acacia pycnantha]
MIFFCHTPYPMQIMKPFRPYCQKESNLNYIPYLVIKFGNEEVLVHKYRIRLRGIDAPESEMPYGKEATEELTKIVEGKCLRILVYEIDSYGRLVGDIYCDNNTFV